MYYTDAKPTTWSRTSHGRGKRTVRVGVGCFLIEHISTGKFLSGVSKTVSQTVDSLIETIDQGTIKSKAMLGLCKLDSDLRLIEFSTKNLKIAEATLEQIKRTTEPDYCILEYDTPGRKRRTS